MTALWVAGLAAGCFRQGAFRTAAYTLPVALLALAAWLQTPRPPPWRAVPQPRREAAVLLASVALGGVYVALRVRTPVATEAGGVHAAWLALGLLCYVPLAPTLWLLARGHRGEALGITRHGLPLVPLAVLLGEVSLDVVHPWLGWWAHYFAHRGGMTSHLGVLLGYAAVEEVQRYQVQSRLGGWWRNRALGIAGATALWALWHLPARLAHAGSVLGASLDCLALVASGMLYGFTTERARSVLPAIALHAILNNG